MLETFPISFLVSSYKLAISRVNPSLYFGVLVSLLSMLFTMSHATSTDLSLLYSVPTIRKLIFGLAYSHVAITCPEVKNIISLLMSQPLLFTFLFPGNLLREVIFEILHGRLPTITIL